MGFLSGKKIVIVGLISNRSIAYGIAEAMHREGAELAFTYQNEKVKNRIADLVKTFDSDMLMPCDVTHDEEIEAVFSTLGEKWGHLDGVVHSVGFAPGDQLEGDYVDCLNREGFRIAHDISSYSLGALAKAAKPLMTDRNGAILTLSYLGAERAVTNYNVMGVAKASLEANVRYLAASLGPHGTRVNAISAGPIKTLAASGIRDFRKMLASNAEANPLKRNVTQLEVGNTAAFLCSDLASGVTGEIIHVDCGSHIV